MCLRWVVPVSMNFGLCSVTVRMAVLQNGRLFRFSKRTDRWCAFSWSICNQNGHDVSTAAVSKVTTTYTNHGKTSSAKRNSGWKQKLSERDRRTLKRTVSKNHRITAAKLTAELIIHLEDAVSTKKKKHYDESFTNPPSTVELQLINLWLLKTTLKGEKDGVMIIKPRRRMTGNT